MKTFIEDVLSGFGVLSILCVIAAAVAAILSTGFGTLLLVIILVGFFSWLIGVIVRECKESEN